MNQPNETNREPRTAAEAYDREQREIERLLERLSQTVRDHRATARGGIDWGHVGDLSRIAARLRDIFPDEDAR